MSAPRQRRAPACSQRDDSRRFGILRARILLHRRRLRHRRRHEDLALLPRHGRRSHRRGCNIGQNVVVSPDVVIGDNVKIQNNVSLYTGVILEDDVFCGPSMVFTNVVNPRSHVSRKHEYRTTLVRRGATLGANCTIVCGHTIGRYAFIGAGAVVTRDVPDYALVVGNPGRISGWVCQCGMKIASGAQPPADVQCGSCGYPDTRRAAVA